MDILKLLVETNIPTIVKEKKPKPVETGSLAKTIAGLGTGFAATTERFGVGKSINALHKSTKAKALPKVLNKMGKFGAGKVGGKLAKMGAWGAGAGLAYGIADSLAFGGGNLLGRGVAGAGEKLSKLFKKPKKVELKIKND